MTRPAPADRRDWGLVALLAACGLLSGLVETLLVPLYAGSQLLPISVVIAIVLNYLLCAGSARTVGRPMGAVITLVLWVLPVLVLPEVQPAGGDVLILGGSSTQQYVYYALILLGCGAGIVAMVRTIGPRATPNGRTER